jgi:hypothetical protein
MNVGHICALGTTQYKFQIKHIARLYIYGADI